MTTPTEPEALIELISEQTRSLLLANWSDIDSYRDGDKDITLSFSHKLSYEGSSRTIKSTISFSHRVKDEVEQSIDTAQADLPLKVTIRKGRTNE
jgi:hypothetical protein